MSNYAPPPQQVEQVPYADLAEMHRFAERWREQHRGKWFRAHKPSGVCLLLKRRVLEAVGGLDERFGLGFFDDHRGAVDYFTRSLGRSAPGDSITPKLHAQLAKAHQELGDLPAAQAVCAAGLAHDPDDAELLFRRGVIRRHAGDPAGAAASWGRILALRPPEQFRSVDAGIYGHLTRRNLARLCEERRDLTAAARLWGEVLAELPHDREALAARQRLGRHCEETP